MEAQRWSKGIASASEGVGGQRHAPAAWTPEDLAPIVQEAGRTLGLLWTGAENLCPLWNSISELSNNSNTELLSLKSFSVGG
jgi:hypothetical protein